MMPKKRKDDIAVVAAALVVSGGRRLRRRYTQHSLFCFDELEFYCKESYLLD
jgi:hypothetical protein